jgi:hypothetical protein
MDLESESADATDGTLVTESETAGGTLDLESQTELVPDPDPYLEWMEKLHYPPSPKEKKALNQMTDEEIKQFITERIRYEIRHNKEVTNHREIWLKSIINFVGKTNSDD